MARIPVFTSRSRAPGPVPGAIQVAGAPARAVAGFAGTVANISADRLAQQRAQQAKLDEINTQLELAELDADLAKQRTEMTITAQEAETGEGLADGMLAGFDEIVKQRLAGIEGEEKRKRAELIAKTRHRNPFEQRLLNLESEKRTGAMNRRLDDVLDDLAISIFRDPAAHAAFLVQGMDSIEAMTAPVDIPAGRVAETKEAFRLKAATSMVRGMIEKSPQQTLAALRDGQFDDTLGDLDTIRKLTGEAARASAIAEAGQERIAKVERNRLVAQVDDHLASIEATGQGIDGLEAALGQTLEPDKFDEFLAAQTRAQTFHEARTTMQFAPVPEIVETLESVQPEPGSTDFADQADLFTATQRAATAIMKQRAEDPAGAAMQAPEIAAQFDEAGTTNDPADLQNAVRASMALQRGMGIGIPRVASKAQADGIAAQIQATPVSGWAAIFADLEESYGPHYDGLLADLTDADIDRRAGFLGEYVGNVALSQTLAQVFETGSKELRDGLDRKMVSDTETNVRTAFEPFRTVLEAGDFTGGATDEANTIQSMVEDLAIQYLRQGSGDPATRAYNDLIASKISIVDGEKVQAYVPIEASAAHVENVLTGQINRTGIEAFGPEPIQGFGDEALGGPAVLERTIDAMLNGGVWVTDETGEAAVFMIRFVGGGQLPVRNAAGDKWRLTFDEIMNMPAVQEAPFGTTGEETGVVN